MQLIDEIIKAATGKDANNKPNAAITISNDAYALDNESTRAISSHSSHKAIINITKIKEHVMVDLVFPSELDPDLKLAWHSLETYEKMIQDLDDDSTEVPFLSLTIVPLIYQSSYYICGFTPFCWTLQPQKPGGSINTIRIVFEVSDFCLYETDEINMEEIEAEVNRKIAAEENQINEMERIEEERRTYEEQRNERMEEYRRNNNYD